MSTNLPPPLPPRAAVSGGVSGDGGVELAEAPREVIVSGEQAGGTNLHQDRQAALRDGLAPGAVTVMVAVCLPTGSDAV